MKCAERLPKLLTILVGNLVAGDLGALKRRLHDLLALLEWKPLRVMCAILRVFCVFGFFIYRLELLIHLLRDVFHGPGFVLDRGPKFDVLPSDRPFEAYGYILDLHLGREVNITPPKKLVLALFGVLRRILYARVIEMVKLEIK